MAIHDEKTDSDLPPRKKPSRVETLFEEWSRPIAWVSMVGMAVLKTVFGVDIHDVAWISCGIMLAGKHSVLLADRVADKVLKAMNK